LCLLPQSGRNTRDHLSLGFWYPENAAVVLDVFLIDDEAAEKLLTGFGPTQFDLKLPRVTV
jgi:hypothetical protein